MSDILDVPNVDTKTDEGRTPPANIMLEDEGGGEAHLSDADALRQANAALEQRASTAERERQAAHSTAAQARDALARERAARATDRRAILGQTLEGADAEIQSHIASKRAARESGDLDAELKSDELLQSARYRKMSAEAELNGLPKEGEAPRQSAGEGQGGGQYTQRTQQWFDAHPRFFSDQSYQKAALALDAMLKAQGISESTNPDEYFRQIDEGLAMKFGDSHGQFPGTEDVPMIGQRSNTNSNGRTSFAGAPNKGGGGSSSATRTVQLASNLGTLLVQRRQGQKPHVRYGDERTKENMIEGAQANWPMEYAKDPAATLARYVEEHLKIADELSSGHNAGLQVTEGTTLR